MLACVAYFAVKGTQSHLTHGHTHSFTEMNDPAFNEHFGSFGGGAKVGAVH